MSHRTSSRRRRLVVELLEDRVNPADPWLGLVDPFAGLADSDLDGLPDDIELFGIDMDGDGLADYTLPGADPNHKDIFVELDAMRGRVPDQAAIDMVVAAFNQAPLANPDGLTGITLHVQVSDLDLPLEAWRQVEAGGVWPEGFNQARAVWFGTDAERADPDAADVLGGKFHVFRYVIFGDSYEETGSSGLARVAGSEFMVTLGLFNTVGGTTFDQAGTFMHELGHTFGLGHDGDPASRANFTPDYTSVMNYGWQTSPTPRSAAHPEFVQFPGNWPDYARDNRHYFDWAALKYNFRDRNAPIPPVEVQQPNQPPEAPPNFPNNPFPQQFDEVSWLIENPVYQSAAYAVGTDTASSQVRVFDMSGNEDFTGEAYPGFGGGVRVVTGDVTGDGVNDLVTVPGPGMPVVVKVFDGVTGVKVLEVQAFESAFTAGAYVAVGDVNGDGFADIAVSPDQGGGPRVKVYSGQDLSVIADFFGIDDPNFRGGARVALSDLDGDGFPDLIVGAGFGGGPRVGVFNGLELALGNTVHLINDFFVFETALRNGVFLSAGDVTGDGYGDLIFGGGPGGGPRVMILDGFTAVVLGGDAAKLATVANFFAGDTRSRGGIRVGVTSLLGESRAAVVIGGGEGSSPRVTLYAPGDLLDFPSAPPVFEEYDAFTGTGYGVFVG